MNGISLLFCLAMIVFLVFAVLLVLSLRPGNKKDLQSTANRPGRPAAKGWRNWIGFIGISLVIAVWTLLGALFFLAVVWILQQNPRPDSSFSLNDNERKAARGIYTWLFFSPMLTIPTFIVVLLILSYWESGTDVRVLASMIPLIFHLPLLSGLTSKNAFLYRHTQQGILLIALRAGMAILATSIGTYSVGGFWLFLLGNGSLWLFGSIWGWNQISRGECWWMKQKGEKLIAPESIKAGSPEMDKELEDMLKSLNVKDKLSAKTKVLNAFRAGTPETKKRAVEVLSKLGEVEEF